MRTSQLHILSFRPSWIERFDCQEYLSYLEQLKLDGPYIKWHLNGKIAIDGEYNNGLKIGEWKQFHSNGKLHSSATYVDNKLEGRWYVWYDNDVKAAEGRSINGQEVGLYCAWDKTGKLKDEATKWTYTDKNGKKVQLEQEYTRCRHLGKGWGE